jgi:hypothetical protein
MRWQRKLSPVRFYRTVRRTVINLWRYRQFLLHNLEGDFGPLLDLLGKKFAYMADEIGNNQFVMRADQTAKELRIASELCKRIDNNELDCNPFTGKRDRAWAKQVEAQESEAAHMLGKLIGRKLRTWWD